MCERGQVCATPLRRSHPRQSGMTAKLVVKHLVVLELPFEIGLVPKPNPIQIFAPDGSDQSLDESVRTWGVPTKKSVEAKLMRRQLGELTTWVADASDRRTTEI